MKRPAPWVARRIATAKALRALPKCETEGCDGRGMGLLAVAVPVGGNEVTSRPAWLCVKCASEARRAQREKRLFCEAMTYSDDRPQSCCEEPGHTGPHRRGILTWTDAEPIPRADAPRET